MKLLSRHRGDIAVVLLSLAIFLLVKLVMANKFAFLNLYFIPVLLAGYFLGRRPAIMSSFLAVLLTVLFVVSWPDELLRESAGQLSLGLDLLVWGSFLILMSVLVSVLNDSRRRRIALATEQLLKKYVERSLEGKDSHTARVANLAARTAKELHLPDEVVKRVETAGHLHDLSRDKLTVDLVADRGKLVELENETTVVSAIPLVLDGFLYRTETSPAKSPSLAAKILAMADVYDEIIEETQETGPLEAVQEIERNGQFDPIVLKALRRVVSRPAAPNLVPQH